MRSIIGIGVLFGVTLGCAQQEKSNVQEKSSASVPSPKVPEPSAKAPAANPAAAPVAKAAEADYIKVQHCLIAFKGSLPKPGLTRTKEEAKTLAYEILEKARKGEDFDALVKTYTDDSHPGIYGMSNLGKPPKPNYYPRNGMVAAFGDTGFPLQVGEYGMADYDTRKSPYGWHIVKRIE